MPSFLTPGGIALYYELNGPVTAPALVFLSGLTGDHNNWWLQVQSFSPAYRCLTFDWRDTGQSGPSPSPEYDLVDMAGDVAALLTGLELEACHLVGLSMGGAVAQEVALNYPALVKSLTLASTFVVRPVPSILPESKRTPGNLRHWAAVSRHDTTNRLPSLQIPTLVVAGSRDHTTPPEGQQAYAATIPAARYVLIEGAGHLVNLEKAGEFNRQLRAFIEAVEGGQAG